MAGMLLMLFRQSFRKFIDGLGHLLHGYVAARDGMIEQQPGAGDDGHEQQYKDDDK